MTMTADHYGRGAALPLRVGSTGGVREAAGIDLIEQSIRVILGTQHGERIMRPDFGANLASLAFAANTPATANLARHLVTSALARWEPRIEVLDVDVSPVPAENALVISVTYSVVGSPDLHELVQRVSLD